MKEISLAQRYINMLISTNTDSDLRREALALYVPHVVDLFVDPPDFFMVTLSDLSSAFGLRNELMYTETAEEYEAYCDYLAGKSRSHWQHLVEHIGKLLDGAK